MVGGRAPCSSRAASAVEGGARLEVGELLAEVEHQADVDEGWLARHQLADVDELELLAEGAEVLAV